MAKLTVIAQMLAKPGTGDFVQDELTKLLEPTRAEAGCITYDLHQDNDNPELFIMFEVWESPEHLQAHSESAHLKAFMEFSQNIIDEFNCNMLTHIA